MTQELVTAFVHAQSLRARRSWRGTIKLEIIARRLDQFHVIPVAFKAFH